MTDTEHYDVVLLVEQELSAADALQVRSLHEGLDQPVHYHVLIPVEDAAGRVEAAMGSLAAGEVLAAPALALREVDLAEVRRECLERSNTCLDCTLKRLQETGATATGQVIHDRPVDALAKKVKEVDGREAIILTRPHVVAEFFHVDWTSRARRHLGVPVLHLLEHENFDEQAGSEGEGISGV